LLLIFCSYEKCFLQHTPHTVLLNEDFYHKSFKGLLADWTLLWLARQGMDIKKHGGVARNFLSGDRRYCAIERTTTLVLIVFCFAYSNLDLVNALPEDRDKRMLNLCSDWLSSFMPHVLQKIDRVTFGIMTKGDIGQKRDIF
jgi:hypothetical protein